MKAAGVILSVAAAVLYLSGSSSSTGSAVAVFVGLIGVVLLVVAFLPSPPSDD